MKILVINPNTSDAMTEDIRNTVLKVKSADTDVAVIHPDFGPEALESFYDYQLASFGMLRLAHSIKDDYDGIVIACFGDPGLYALKEIFPCPVIGIAEGSMAVATLLGSKFAVLAASDKAAPMMDNMVMQYGLKDRCAGIFTLHTNVLEAEKDKENTIQNLINIGKAAQKHGADVLILGCAGMTGLASYVETELNITVIDPVSTTFVMMEMLVKLKIKTSKAGMYAMPMHKYIMNKGLLEKANF